MNEYCIFLATKSGKTEKIGYLKSYNSVEISPKWSESGFSLHMGLLWVKTPLKTSKY